MLVPILAPTSNTKKPRPTYVHLDRSISKDPPTTNASSSAPAAHAGLSMFALLNTVPSRAA